MPAARAVRLRSVVCLAAAALLAWASTRETRAQVAPAIVHQAPGCLPQAGFPMIRAQIEPSSTVRAAKVYFRSDRHPELYYVEMSRAQGRFEAVLPMPASETTRIIYYIEVVDVFFNSARTPEYTPVIDRQCPADPASVFPGQNPAIVVGALNAGAAVIPLGFQAAGIAGAASAAAGGIGVGTAVAVAAGAAGVAGAGVVAAGSEETTTSTVRPTTTTSTLPPSSTSTVVSTTTTTSIPAPTTTTTSASTSTTSTGPTSDLRACFTTDRLNSCKLKFDARCSTGDVKKYRWEIDTGGVVGGPYVHETPAKVYNHDFGTCAGQVITVVLTVADRDGRTSTVTQPVTLPTALTSVGETAVQTSFLSTLYTGGAETGVRAYVVVDRLRLDEVNSRSPFRHQVAVHSGTNTAEAFASAGLESEAFWRFDFSAAEHFVPGSLGAEQGQVVFRDTYSIVFRLSGAPEERIRFTFRLR